MAQKKREMEMTQINNWIGNNIKWILTLIILSISNYYILANKIESNSRSIITNANEISVLKTREIKELSEQIRRLENKDITKNDVLKEMKFNLKRFMEIQGIKYIEDTDK